MTPLEINKKIAKIKGLKILHQQDNGLRVSFISANKNVVVDASGDAESKMILNIMDSCMGPIFNWAENIADAWQLFEENQEVYLKKMHYTDGTIIYQCVFRDSNLNVLGDAKTDTAPMAIALAWLAWKENK